MSDQLAALAAQYGGAPVGAPPPDFTASNVPVDARGVPLDAPRDARGQIISSKDEEPGMLDQLNAMLGPLAHPQTLTDFARLLTLPVDSVRKALASAVSMAAARPAASATLSATGRGLEKAGTLIDKPSRYVGAAEVVTDPKRALLTLVAPSTMRAAGRALQRGGAALAERPPLAIVPPTIGEAADTPAVTAAAAATESAAPTAAAPAGATPTAEAPAWTPAKLRLTAEESKVAAKLIQAGKTDAEVEQAIQLARELQRRLGSPTDAAARAAIQKRNLKG